MWLALKVKTKLAALIRVICLFLYLFDLLLYVDGKQLRPCRDGLILTSLFLGKP